MKKLLLCSLFVLLIASPVFAGKPYQPGMTNSILYQLGTIDSMMKGCYEEAKNIGEIKSFSNMGIGTTTKLGEVIGIDGKYYLADANGNVKLMSSKTQIPYLTATNFLPDASFKADNIENAKAFYALLEKHLKGDNIFYAIRVDGTFQKVDARSEDFLGDKAVPLGEWVKDHQKIFTFKNISGTLVIFKCPQFINGIGVGGYHAHFISSDKKFGGHVFDFAIIEGKVSTETIYEMGLIIPKTEVFQKFDLDKSKEKSDTLIKAVETKS